ncbi:hypothetical protein [Rhizobacter sp. Root404]|uniref:hypothetical protein n=1 Tax=Rhizobacter sp. Root404 TaxID=1736528 RepID=UPI0006FC8211|nr:hypothetical protein [Rhizobacter sp. Root404]KQW39044.1 hypothetical protein ASC76_13940 [Rhizobacter sp. Root404]
MKKTRAPDLTPELIQAVLETLDNWKGKLTWDLLLAAVEKASGIAYSRFTLAEYSEVANAFSLKKEVLRSASKSELASPRDERVRAALEQATRLQSKVDRLKQENALLKEQFVTWALNAERKGVTMTMLNAPLAKPQRDRTKGED